MRDSFELLANANSEEFKRRYPDEVVGTSGPVRLIMSDSIMNAERLIQDVSISSFSNPIVLLM